MRASRSSSATAGASSSGMPTNGSGEWELEGPLTKKGHVRTNWKTRQFKLRGSTLAYFSGAGRQKGAAELGGARVQALPAAKHEHCFELVEAGGRRFLLAAPSADALAAWLNALRPRAAACPPPAGSASSSAAGSPAHRSAGSGSGSGLDVLLLPDDTPAADEWSVLVLGEAGVGKTSLLLRFCMDQFVQPDPLGVRPPPDLSRARTSRVLRVAGQVVRLTLQDTQGSELFRTISTGQYMAADAVVLVFAHGGGPESLSRCEVWWREAQKYVRGGAPFVLAGNKADLPVAPELRTRAARAAAMMDDMPYIECSAASGERVAELFLQVARSIARQRAPRVFG